MTGTEHAFFPRLREFLRDRRPFTTAMLALGVLVPLGFVLYTNQAWEDFFITYRHSENLVQGQGLVFTPGERVHGFTSPLNTLLPALFAWIAQAKSYLLPLFLYRIVSLGALLFALVCLSSVVGEGQEPAQLRWHLCALFPLLVVLEIKTTAFAMNGQEAGLMLGFLAPVFVLAYRGWPRGDAWFGGVCLAGLMYTRPDGFVYALALAGGAFAFCERPRREFLAAFARSVGLSVLLYVPWVVFAQSYYGSFIPHTITAKGGSEYYPASTFGLFAPVVSGITKLPERLCGALAAIYDFQQPPSPSTWPAWIHDAAFAFESAAVTYWLFPTRDRLGRMASLCSLLMLCYLTYASLLAPSCPWYYPPLAFLSILALVRMFVTLPAYLPRWSSVVSVSLFAALLFFFTFIFSFSLRALKLKQEVIDDGNRRAIGLWLKENVSEKATVYLEPLGYIGYFSQRKMLDWPGLVSPEVVAARRKIGHVPGYPWGNYLWAKGAEELKPDWIVARPTEVEQMKASPSLLRDYQLVKVFNVTESIIAAGEFYGCAITYNEAVFEIFRRRALPVTRPEGAR